IFVLYFIAGLKKLDQDWVTGYSMQFLSKHWVFDPFKFILTEDQIDMYIIHLGGLFIDLFLGFLLFFDKTRPLAFVMCSSFHLMNSQIFHIGAQLIMFHPSEHLTGSYRGLDLGEF
ncbi:vitamin K-dependent gamma-carboxylase-like, partial [Gigantopelta aegis]|uniref:vitamin K-dependent gamma-carboxylase-like n=1 Tax=Gigantopelta aegis TaxID=1735272 RepID=UPI001B88BE6F